MSAHGPIIVHNETELADLMALNQWPGDGSSSHPYLIGNLEINATGSSNAISIGNTSSYLIITNSLLANASSMSAGFGAGAGLSLFNTSNVLIVNNTISDCRYGIVVRNSTLTTAYNNTISQCSSFGLVSNVSSDNRFYENAFMANHGASSIYDLVHAQAYEDGTGDLWSSAHLGNFWSDQASPDVDHDSIIDSAYFLAGPGNATDAHPLAALVASPYGLSAVVGQGSVYLTWTGVNYSIGSPVIGLKIHRISSTGDNATISLGADVVSYNDTGLHYLSDYTYYLTAQASSESPASMTVAAYTYDAYAPTISVLTPANGTISKDNWVEMTWTAADSGSGVDHFLYRIDGNEWESAGTQTTIMQGAFDGNHTFDVKVFDRAGNSATASCWYIVDTTAPSLAIGSPAEGSYLNTTSVTVSCTGCDAGTGIAGYQYLLDSGYWSGSTNSTSISYTGLEEGAHTVYIKITDIAGNSRTSSVSFTVDVTVPTLVIDSPSNNDWVNRSSFTVLITGADTGCGVLGYQYRLEGGTWSEISVSPSFGCSVLSQGAHTIDVRVFDKALNNVTASVSFKVDSYAPVVSISSPAEGFLSDTDQVTFIWSGSDNGSGLTGFRYHMDDGDWSSSSMFNDLTLTGLADGDHILTIQAFDLAGLVKNASVSFVIDTTAPAVTITAPIEGAFLNTSTVNIDVAAIDASSPIKGYQFRVDGQAWSALSLTTTHQFTSLAEGMHIVEVQVFDSADNVRLTSRNFTVDTVPASISITSPTGVIYSSVSSMRVDWTGSDLNSGLQGFQYRMDSGEWSPVDGAMTNLFTDLADGVHTVYVRSLDNSNNIAVASVSFTVDTTAPYLSISAPTEGTMTQLQSMTVSWDGGDNTSGLQGFRFRIDGGGWSAIAMTETYGFVGLADGNHKVDVLAIDRSNNVATVSVNFIVDSSPPSLSISSPSGGYYSASSSVTVTWTGSDPTSGLLGFQFKIDTDGYSTTSLVYDQLFSGLADGWHTVSVKAYDKIGNTVTRTVTFYVDTSIPAVQITAPEPDLITNETALTVVWEGSDATGGIAGYYYKIDSGAWSALTGATSHTFLGLRDGDHMFVVKVIDHANNYALDFLNFTVVDTVPPVLTILSPSQNAFLGSSSVHVVWNATDLTSGVQGFLYRIDGSAWSEMTADSELSFTSTWDGQHTVEIIAFDNANNSIMRSVTFTVDTTAPEMSITSPAMGFNSDSSTVKVIWFAYDATAGLSGYQYRIDGQAWSAPTQAISHDFAGLAQGPHTAEARSIDKAGNNATASVTFIVDTYIPLLSIISPSEGAYVTSSVTVRVSSSDPTSGISGYQFRIDGQAWSPISDSPNATFVGLPDGMHTFDARSFDGAGNWARVTSTFTVDTDEPAILIISPASGSCFAATSVTVSWMGSDAVSGVQGYQYRIGSGEWSSVSTGTSHLFAGLQDGDHTIGVQVFDKAGNSATASITVTIDTVSPIISILDPVDGFETTSSTVHCNWTASDATSGVQGYQYRIDGSGWSSMTAATGIVLTDLQDGGHVLTVMATDRAGNTATSTLNFTTDSFPPIVDINSVSINGPVGDRTVVIGWTGHDYNSGITGYQYRIDGDGWTPLSMDLTATYSGLAEGYHVFYVRAFDRAGNMGYATSAFDIGGTGATFAITSPGWHQALTTDATTVTWGLFKAFDIDHYEFKLDGGAWTDLGLSTSQPISGLSEGWHIVYVRAVDVNGTALNDSNQFTVDTVAPTLTIVSPSEGSATSSVLVTVSCSLFDATSGIDRIQFDLDDCGWSVPTLSYSYSYYLPEGDHQVDVRAWDKAGHIVTASVNFTVDRTAPVISLLAPTAGSYCLSSSVTVSAAGSDVGSGIQGYLFKVDGGAWTDIGASSDRVFDGLSVGQHTVWAKDEDRAGNSATASVTFYLDNVLPTLSITSPADGFYSDRSSVQVIWLGDDAQSGLKGFSHRLDGGSWSAMTDDISFTFAPLSEGIHLLDIRATDNANNVIIRTVTVMVDTIAPTIAINGPAGGYFSPFSSVNVTWNGNDSMSGVDGYIYRIDGKEWTEMGSDLSHVFGPLSEGMHLVEVRVFDMSGNFAKASVNFTVDTAKPLITITSPDEAIYTNSSSIQVNWAGSDPTSGIKGYRYQVDSQGWSDLTEYLTHTFTSLSEGSHTVYVRAYDQANNFDTATVGFMVDTVRPTISFSAPTDGVSTSATSMTVTWLGVDPTSGILGYRYDLDGSAWSGLMSGTTFTFTNLLDGIHTVEICAFDRAGNNRSGSVEFTVDTVPPILSISSPSNGAATSSTFMNVAWHATDATTGVQGYQFRLDSDEWSDIDLGLSNLFIGLSDGSHTVSVRAVDNVGNVATSSVTFIIDTGDHNPPEVSITSPSNGSVCASSNVIVTWTGSDVPSGVQGYKYRLDGASWSSISGMLVHGFSGLADGTHTVEIMIYDRADNIDTAMVNFTVDTTAPVLEISSPAANAFLNIASPHVFWSATDATTGVNGYQYRIDAGEWSSTASSTDDVFPGLSQGSHTVDIKAIDNAGNSVIVSVTFVVDTVDPTISITSPPNAFISGNSLVTVIWTGSDATSGLAGYRYRIDAGEWSSLVLKVSNGFSGLAQGPHTVDVMAVDRSSNFAVATVGFTVDTVPPVLTITSPANLFNSNSSTVMVNWTATDATSGISGYQYRIDGGSWSSVVTALGNTFSGLIKGLHKVDVKVIDNAGNTAQGSVSFTVDTTFPTVSITSPANNYNSKFSSVNVVWTGADVGTGVQGYQYRIDSGAWSTLSGSLSHTFDGLEDGSHTVNVRVFDNANNVASTSVTFKVDTVNPAIAIDSPSSDAIFNVTSVTVHWTGSDLTSGVAGYQYKLDSGSWSSSSMSVSHVFGSLTDGTHTVYVKITDNAGNTNTASVTFVIDTVVPALTITSPASNHLTNQTTVTVIWTGSDATSGVQAYRYRIDSGAWSELSSDLTHDFEGLLDGSHTVNVQVFDNANLVTIRSVTFTVDTVPPVLVIETPSEGNLINMPFVTWSATDATSGILGYQYRADGGAWSTRDMSTDNSFGLADGPHTVTVRAFDMTGSCSYAFVNFTLDATPPTIDITSPADYAISASSTVTVFWTGSDALSGITGYQYSLDGSDWSVLSSDLSHEFSGLGDTTHTVDIQTWDLAGNNAVDTVRIIIDTGEPDVSITSPSNGFISSSTTVSVSWTGSDLTSGLAGFQYKIDTDEFSPLSLTASHSFSALDQGTHTVVVEAEDNAGNKHSVSVTFNVDTIQPTISITTPSSGAITGFSSVQVNWTGADENSGVWHYRSHIDAVAWSGYSGSLTRTFVSLTTGVHTVYVEVQDNAGNTGSASVSFTVDLVAPVLMISAPSNNAYFNLSTVHVFWNATDANTGVQGYQYKVDSEPYSDLSMTNSQAFAGLGEGSHTVYIKAYDNVNNVVTVTVTFMVDTVAPIVSVTTPTEALLTNSSLVNWAGIDVTSGILNYQSCIDGGAWSSASTSTTRTFTGLADGNHVIQVRAFDKAGNLAITFRNFTLDATPPGVVISAPTNLKIFNVTTVTVNWNGTDNLAGILGYQYKLDAGVYSGTITEITRDFTGLSEGLHTVIIKAIDNAHNEHTATIQFRVDSVGPVLTITAPSANAYKISSSVAVTWTSVDSNSGVQGSQYRIDSGSWSTLASVLTYTFTGLLDGSHTVDVRSFDNANKVSSASVTFTVDTVNPTLVISNPVNLYLTNTTSVTVFWNGTDATSGINGYQYSLDGAGYSVTAAPIFHLFSGLTNGNHYVNIKALDKAGLTTIRKVNFTVDNVAPVLTISSPTGGAYLGTSSVAVTWSSTDAVSGVSGYQYRVDGGAWSDKAMVLTCTFTGLSDAPHTVDVRAFDVANNVRTASVGFTVDITNPTVSITSPSDRALVGIATVTWTGNDATSGLQGYRSRVDNQSWSTVALTLTRTFTGLIDGSHFIEVQALDRSGNTFTVSVNFTLDMTAPVVSITSPANGFITNSTTVKVDWTATDSPAGVQGYQYRIDAGGWNGLSGAVTNDFAGLSDGLHTVYVQAVDNAGNSAITSVTFRVDTIAPAVSITSPAAGYYSSSSTVTVVWTATDGGSGVKGFQYHIDSEDWSSLAWVKNHAFSGLSEGDHTVYIRAMDNASLPSETSVTFNVDTVAPEVQIDSPANNYITNITTVTVGWSGSDDTSGIAGYQYQLDSGTWSGISMLQTNVFTSLSNAVHTVTVRILDRAGNTADASVSFTMDNIVPSVSISAPAVNSYTDLTSTTVVWSGSDSLSGVQGYQYSMDGAAWSSLSLGVSQGFTGLAEGDHTARVKATDNAQNFRVVSITVHVDLTAPTLTISSPSEGSIFNSSTVTVSGSATDASSGVHGYEYRVDGQGWSVSSGSLSHVFSSLSDGSHKVEVRSTDNVGNSEIRSVNFTADVTAPTLTITAPTAGQNFNLSSVLVSWTGSDLGTGLQGFRYKIDTGVWSSIDMTFENTFSSLAEQTHTVYVEAYDVAHNHVMASITFRVDTIAPTLSITAPSNGLYVTVNSMTVTWTRSDLNSGIQGCSYSIDGLAWSSISFATVSNMFAGLTDGEHTADVRCFDNAGNIQTRSVSFTVDTVDPTLSIDNPSNLFLTNSTSVTVYWNGSDATSGIQGYQYQIDNGGYSATSADISHTFSGQSNGLHRVDVKAIDVAGRFTVRSVNFTVDNVAPVLSITAPIVAAYLGSSSVTATWTATDATTAVSGYQCSIDGGEWSVRSSDLNHVFDDVADGSHTILVRVFDLADNLRTMSVTFVVDVTAPVITVTVPSEGALVTSIDVTWNGTDATSGMHGYQYRIDNGSWSTSAMGLTHIFAGQIDGGHFIEVKATDRSNNFAIASVHLTLDTSDPFVSITSPAANYNSSSSTVTVDWSGHDVITAIKGYEYRVDGGEWSPLTGAVTHDFTGLIDGIHTVYVKAFDLVDNTATTSVTFRVDTVDPAVSITAPVGGYYSPSTSVRVDWTGSDSGSGMLGYQYRVDGLGWSATAGALTFSFEGLAQGNHTVDVRAIDRAGNDRETSVTFNVDTVAPIVNITAPMEGLNTNSTTVSVFWTGNDPTSGIKGYQFQIDTGSWSVRSLDLTHDFAGLTDGPHTVTVKAYDNADNTATALFHCIVDTVAPSLVISHPTDGWFTGGTTAVVFWNGSDPTSGIQDYQFSLDGAAWTSNGMVLSHAFHGLSEGTHTVSVMVTDHALNSYVVSLTFTVDLTAPSLEITAPLDSGIYDISTITAEWSATDGSSGLLGYGYRIDGGAWSATSLAVSRIYHDLGEGPHTFDVYALDNVLNNVTGSVTFMVDTVSPSLSITAPTTGQMFNHSSVVVTWAGGDGTSLIAGYQYRLDTGAWSEISNDLEHVFGALGEGNHTVSVMAMDNAGNTRSASVIFMVDTVSPSISITLPYDGAVINNTQFTWGGSDVTSGILGYQYRIDSGEWSEISLGLAHTFAGLAEGLHHVDVLAQDKAGNSAMAQVDFTLDTVSPTLILDLPFQGIFLNSSDVHVIWHAEDVTSGVHGYSYRLDGGEWSAVSMTSDLLFPGLAEGYHTVTVRAYDNVNLRVTSSVTFMVDTVSPTLTIDVPDEGALINVSSATVSWSAGDIISGLQGTQYRLDGAVWSPLSNLNQVTFAGLADGHHTVDVRAYDWANNTFSASVGFTIDTTGPDLTISHPGNGAIIGSSYIMVEWDGGDPTSGIAGYQGRIDNGAWSELGMGLTESFDNMIDGPHTVDIRAFDVAGHFTVSSVSFTTDTVAPLLTITSPTNGTFWNTPTVHVTWTSSDATTSVYDYRIRAGNAPWVSGITDLFADVSFTGNKTVILEARDLAGNVATAIVYFTIDTESPYLAIDTPIEGIMFNVSWAGLAWSSGDNISGIGHYQFNLDGGDWSEPQASTVHNLTGLTNGMHTAGVRATDRAGNLFIKYVSFHIDTTAPVVSITAPSEGHYFASSSNSVTWTGADIGVGVQGFKYRVDGGDWSQMTTDIIHSFILLDGVHTVDVKVYDWANNTAIDHVNFTVDTVAPSIEITVPVDGHYANSSTVGVNWTASDLTAGIFGYQHRIDMGPWSGEGLLETMTYEGLSEGPHTVSVKVYDRAGNMAETNVTFTVDTVAPSLAITAPMSGQILDHTEVNVSWEGSDLTTWIAGYIYSVDGGAWSTPGLGLYHVFPGLGEGEHTVSVMAYDHLGNVAVRSVTFTVDTVVPNVAILLPHQGIFTNISTVQVTWEGSDETSGILGYRFKLDGGQWSTSSLATAQEFHALADGWHTVYVEAMDNAHNTMEVSVTFLVDTTAPSIEIIDPADGSVVNSSHVGWIGSDLTSNIAGYQYRIDSGEWSANMTGLETILAGLVESSYTVDVKAWDRANNSAIASITFFHDTVKPMLIIVSPADRSGFNFTDIIVVWSATDNSSAITGYQYQLDGGEWSPIVLLTGHSFAGLADGYHDISVRAFDSANNCAERNITILIDSVAPSIGPIEPADGMRTGSSSVQFNWTVEDITSGLQGVRYRLDGGEWSPLQDLSVWDFVLQLEDGNYTLDVQALDNLNNVAMETLRFQVDTVAPVLEIISPAEGAYIPTPWAVVSWIAGDVTTGVHGYQYRIDEGAWSSPSMDLGSNFTELTDGPHRVEVKAFDQVGNSVFGSVSFLVDTTAPTEQVTAMILGLLSHGNSCHFVWLGADNGSGIAGYQYALDGAGWSGLTQSVSVSLRDLDDGMHIFRVRAIDNAGNIGLASVSILIDITAPVLTITSPVDGTFYNITTGNDVTVTWTASDATSGIAHYLVRVNGGGWTKQTGRSLSLSGLADGAYQVDVRAVDTLGNTAESGVNFTVDLTAPTLAITAPTGKLYNVNGMTASWTGNDDLSGLSGFRFRLDAGPWSAMRSDLSAALSSMTQGEHTLEVEATDVAGNVNMTSVKFSVDSVAPIITAFGPEGSNVAPDAVVTVTFSEAMNRTSVELTVTGVTGTIRWEGNTVILTPAGPLAHLRNCTVSVSGQDLAGNAVQGGWSFTVIDNGTVSGRIVDSDGNPVANAIVSGGGKNVTTDANGEFTLNLQDGDHQLTVFKEGKELAIFNATTTPGERLDVGEIKVQGIGLGSAAPWGWIIAAVNTGAMFLILVFAMRRRFYVLIKGTGEGQVLSPFDRPIKKVAITLDSGEMTVTDAEGRFRLEASSRVYQMTAEKKGRKSRSFPVTIEPGQTYETEIYWMRRK